MKRRGRGVITLVALSMLLYPSFVHAQGTASGAGVGGSPSSERDQILWNAAALSLLLERQDYPALLTLSALGRAVEERGDSALSDLAPLVRVVAAGRSVGGVGALTPPATDDALADCRDERDLALGTLCAMERLAPLAPAAFARDLTEQGAQIVALAAQPLSGRYRGGATGLVSLFSTSDPVSALSESALRGASLVRERGDVGADDLVSGLVGLPALAGLDVLTEVPALQSVLAAYPIMYDVGFQEPAGAVSQAYSRFLDDLANPAASMFATELDPRATWAAGRSFVYLASQAAGASGTGRDVVNRISTLGAATVDLQREARDLPRALAAMGRDVAAAALSGNVLGIASRITSLFQFGGGGPDAVREIRSLREELSALRSDFDADLAGLDERVATTFAALDTSFVRLEGLLGTTRRDVRQDLAALHQDVLALDERVGLVDTNVRSYVLAGFDRDYARTLVRCLDHRQRYAPPWDEMGFELFSECLADFRARAVVDAADALLTDQATPVDDESLVTALSNQSFADLSYRLPLLGRVADQRFGNVGLAGGHGLVNLVEWRVAVEAYVTLLGDWPEHARAVRPGDLEVMRAVGLQLRRALEGIASGGASEGRPRLIGSVLEYYERRLADLTAEGDSLARRHRQEGLLRVTPESVLTRLVAAGAPLPELEVPSVIASEIPQAVRSAAVLGLDDVALKYRLVTEDSVIRQNFRHRFLFFGRRHERVTFTRTSIEVDLSSDVLGEIGRFAATGPFVLTRTEQMNGDATSDDVRSRIDNVEDPRMHFLAAVWPLLAPDSASWIVEPVAGEVTGVFERRIEDEMRRHATNGLNAVFASVCAAVPASDGLADLDRASAVRIRGALLGLSAARVLLEGYLRLGLPEAFESDAELRDGLSGPDSVLDRDSLCDAVGGGESPLRMVWLEQEPVRRVAALRTALDRVLASAEEGGRTLVDSTLEQLDAAIRVQRLRAASAAR